MPYDGTAWDETNPTNSTIANEIDDVARDMKTGTRVRMQNEHIWPAAQTGTGEAGFHTVVSLQAQTGTPTMPIVASVTQAGMLFVTSGALMFKDSANNLSMIVPGAADTGGVMPAGATIPYAGNSTPDGWLLCTGGAFSRTTYLRLFTAIGTIHGTGDGATTFNVPALQGYTVVAKSAGGIFNTMAKTTGELTHTLTIAEMPSHTHTVTAGNAGAGGQINWGNFNNSNFVATSSATGGDGAHNNVQPSYVLNYIIRY